jgi:hypothetical protein
MFEIKVKHKDRDNGNGYDCCLCGRKIPYNKDRKSLHMVQTIGVSGYDGIHTTWRLSHIKDWGDFWESGDYGYVGNTCAKKVPPEYKKEDK